MLVVCVVCVCWGGGGVVCVAVCVHRRCVSAYECVCVRFVCMQGGGWGCCMR